MYKWIIDIDAEREEYKKACDEDMCDSGDRYDTAAKNDLCSGDNEPGFSDEFVDDDESVYEEDSYISVGDEIGRWAAPGGIVLGRICNHDGDAVCYKIWVQTINSKDGYIDYVQASDISMHELCDDAEWSLRRIGYTLVVEKDSEFSYFYNKNTGDIALW